MCNEIHFEDNRVSTAKIKSDIKNQKKKLSDATLQEVTNNTSCKTKLRSIEASRKNGGSIWLTVIPIKRNGFFLEKKAFWHAIWIRCNIPLERLPALCASGDSFNLQHVLSCPKGGLVITRHNEMRNLTAEILGEVCKNVVIKPLLTALMGEELPKSTNTSSQARGFSTHLPDAIYTIVSQLFIKRTKTKRNGSVTSQPFKWNMVHSHHLCFHVLEKWAGFAYFWTSC